jgi:hypothetical protein
MQQPLFYVGECESFNQASFLLDLTVPSMGADPSTSTADPIDSERWDFFAGMARRLMQHILCR